jgi:hypothetical protein
MPRFNLPFSVATVLCFGTLICVPNFAYADWQLVWSDEFNGTSINQNSTSVTTRRVPSAGLASSSIQALS